MTTLLQNIINSYIDENTNELQALELILSERTGKNFKIWDYKLGKVEEVEDEGDMEWGQYVTIIGMRPQGYKEIMKPFATKYYITNYDAEVEKEIEDKSIFCQEAQDLYNRDGSILITDKIVNGLEFTDEELRKCAEQILNSRYDSDSETEGYIWEDEANQEVIENVFEKILDIAEEAWNEMGEEDQEDYDNDLDMYQQEYTEGMDISGKVRQMIINKIN